MGYRVEVFDRAKRRVGEIDTWISLDFTVRFCAEGIWQLLIKDGTPQSDLIEKGGGVVIWQEGVSEPLLSGQVDTYQKYWTKVQHTGPGSLYIAGKCHNRYAYSRLAFPETGRTIPQQYSGRSTRAVAKAAGSAVWEELNSAVGAGALSDRRVVGVNAGPDPQIGPTLSDNLRYDQIGAKLEEWCRTKNIGYRFIYNSTAQEVDLKVFVPRDLSKEIRFSPELGNLREYIYTLSAPLVTRIIVACQGDGKERYIWQLIDSESEAEWGTSYEQLIDRRDIPLKTDTAGNPVLITTIDSDGFEDIGQNPEGLDWTPDVAAKRKALVAAEAAAQKADQAHDKTKSPYNQAVNNLESVKEAVTRARKRLAEADTAAEKAAAQKALDEAEEALGKATTAYTTAKAAFDSTKDAFTDAAGAGLLARAALKTSLTAAKPTAVAHYLSVIREAAQTALKETEKTGNFQVYPIDTDFCRFGEHYFVGDKVTVVVDGVEYVDVIREVTINVDDAGKVNDVSPKIGQQGSGEPLNLYKTVSDLQRKLRRLEARM
ncbi:siphovirus ReqiPepy6 Gp37-like family protein [Streptomyces sp. NBC_00237]|uniref:Gp37-like protein n=1 Tax=Streptomyces sp. NBC_00237 TaxID=2975687 RepID=UPI00224FE6DE|nr:hypothetical protein [Streptomyces sp. NBC_00237]MCX5201482.1 siphovirus ReqiPepy6 Gp37-like family protein [Streptomyces sp. NBC_00237]